MILKSEIVPPHLILHVPHASKAIPSGVRGSILLSEGALDLELIRMTVAFTDEIFCLEAELAAKVVCPVSRLVVDVERFCNDEQEEMSTRGMGAVYTHASDRRCLRLDDAVERKRLLDEYYFPHHARLTCAIQSALDHWGSAFIIDGHSFSPTCLPHEPDQEVDRPDICIGSDPYHSPDEIVSLALTLFRDAGFRVFLNRPFGGSLVPQAYYRQDSRVASIMIEINRQLYQDPVTGERSSAYAAFKEVFSQVLRKLHFATNPPSHLPDKSRNPDS